MAGARRPPVPYGSEGSQGPRSGGISLEQRYARPTRMRTRESVGDIYGVTSRARGTDHILAEHHHDVTNQDKLRVMLGI